MRRQSFRLPLLAIALLSLVLAACAQEVVYVTPAYGVGGVNDSGDGVVLPAEAQRVIDRATATAGAVATQAAFASATERSAESTSTVAYHATWDTLALVQTEAAMGATATSQSAAATDASARASSTARTADAFATPTAAAIRTQAALAIAQARREQASADDAAEFWKSLRAIIVAVVGVVGVVAVVLLWIWGKAHIRVEEMRQQAAVAQSAFRVLAPGHWAEYEPGAGYQVYELPGLLNAPAVVIDNVPTATDIEHAWRSSFRAFCWAGERWGFSMRTLAGLDSPYRVISEPGWRQLRRILKNNGVLIGENDGTHWAGGWDYRTFSDALSTGRLLLPHPNEAPPDVSIGQAPHTTTQNHTTPPATLTTPAATA